MYEIIPINAFTDNYIWCLVDQQKSQAIVVDPGDAAPVIEQLEKLKLKLRGILITHHHADHCGGLADLLNYAQVDVYAPADHRIPSVTYSFAEENIFLIDELLVKVLCTPGHTKSHIAYYMPELEILFTGDTLFTAGCGRLFEGTPAQMVASLHKILTLPAETLIYCGHEYTLNNLKFALSIEPDNLEIQKRLALVKQQREKNLPSVPATLLLEQQTNPFLRCNVDTVIRSAEKIAGRKLHSDVEIFAVLRTAKDVF